MRVRWLAGYAAERGATGTPLRAKNDVCAQETFNYAHGAPASSDTKKKERHAMPVLQRVHPPRFPQQPKAFHLVTPLLHHHRQEVDAP